MLRGCRAQRQRPWTRYIEDGTVATMLAYLAQAAPRPWTDIPGVAIVGGAIGIIIVVAAIRAMTKKGK